MCVCVCVPDTTKEHCRDIFKVAKWGNSAANSFFRTVYKGPLWLPKEQAELAIQSGWNMCVPCCRNNGNEFVLEIMPPYPFRPILDILAFSCAWAKEAYGALARLCKDKGWKLFYIRPKVHMMQHVMLLFSTKCTKDTRVSRVELFWGKDFANSCAFLCKCGGLSRLSMQYQLEAGSGMALNPASPQLRFCLLVTCLVVF